MRVIVCLITIVSASAAFAATEAGAQVGSNCRNIHTIQQAAQAGEMPAIVAALHGGAPISNSLLACRARRQ
jgi:hypothetical protein